MAAGAEAEAKEAPAEGGEASAKGGGKKKIIIIAAAALVLIGGGAGGYFMFAGKKDTAEKAAVKKPSAFIEMKEMVLNLAQEPGQDRPRYLKFKVALEVADSKTLPEIQPLMPRVEDTFQVFVRELRPSDLEGSAGIYRLKEELLRRVNVAVYPAKVDAVLLKEMVIQ